MYYTARTCVSRALQNTGGWLTFLYRAMRDLVCNGQLWARAVPRQLRRTARAFSANSLEKTMEITVVIQYILTATQSVGSQDYCNSRMTILGIILRDKIDYRMFRRKYLFGCLRKLGEFSKQQ